MTKWLIGTMVGLIAASFTLDADAQRRLGGGRTLGKPSQTLQQRQATPPQQQTPPAQQAAPSQQPAPAAATGTAAAPKPASPLKGALMGLAAGLGLAALASWLGFGDTLATIMLVVLAGMLVMMVVGYLMRRSGAQPAYQGAGNGRYLPQPPEAMPRPIEAIPRSVERAPFEAAPAARPGSAMDEFTRATAANLDQPWGIPAGFDAESFLANAKSYFTRLQTAWDKSNLDELSEFTTQEMFTALTHELRARAGASKSEVVTLDAKMLGIESNPTEHLASVRFTGTLRIDGELEQFDEVWNLTKPADGKTGWLLAGIQQLA
jgi:predicted lipid-binding transport protein (Tim44 family)